MSEGPGSTDLESKSVNFTFKWPEGPTNVILTGEFDKWQGTLPLIKTPEGNFQVTFPVTFSEKDKIYFKFIVDGEWTVNGAYPTEYGVDGIENNYITLADVLKAKHEAGAGVPIPEAGGLEVNVHCRGATQGEEEEEGTSEKDEIGSSSNSKTGRDDLAQDVHILPVEKSPVNGFADRNVNPILAGLGPVIPAHPEKIEAFSAVATNDDLKDGETPKYGDIKPNLHANLEERDVVGSSELQEDVSDDNERTKGPNGVRLSLGSHLTNSDVQVSPVRDGTPFETAREDMSVQDLTEIDIPEPVEGSSGAEHRESIKEEQADRVEKTKPFIIKDEQKELQLVPEVSGKAEPVVSATCATATAAAPGAPKQRKERKFQEKKSNTTSRVSAGTVSQENAGDDKMKKKKKGFFSRLKKFLT